MTDRQGMILLLIIGTMMAQVEPEETTRKINKLRKQIRQGVIKYNRKIGDQKYNALVRDAQEIWDCAQDDVDNQEFTVSLSLALVLAYDILEEPYKSMWFTNRTFEMAIGSLNYGYTIEPDIEESSQWLLGRFTSALGIPEKISIFRSIVQQLKG